MCWPKLFSMLCYILQTGADGTDEMSVFRDSLLSLRHCFNVSDPNQHTLDTLEQGISSLIERIPYSLNSSHSSSGSQVSNNHQKHKTFYNYTPRKLCLW